MKLGQDKEIKTGRLGQQAHGSGLAHKQLNHNYGHMHNQEQGGKDTHERQTWGVHKAFLQQRQ